MILPPVHLILQHCHNRWRSSLFRGPVIINPRLLSTIEKDRNQTAKKDSESFAKSQNTQIPMINLTRKVQKTVKDTIYSLVIVAGVVALGGLCYLVLHEFFSRETPNGIYREASKLCIENSDVQEALGLPITVHRSPSIGSMRINNVRSRMFDEKGHQSMTVSFYLTGKERSGVVAVKVRKNISNKFVYDYILVQLDQPWRSQNIIQIHSSLNQSLSSSKD